MEKIINFIKEQIEKLQKCVNEYNNIECLEFYLRYTARTAYMTNLLLDMYIDLDESISDLSKEETIEYIENTIAHFQKLLLSGKLDVYTTNPMVNLTRIWQFETYPTLINELKHLIVKINE